MFRSGVVLGVDVFEVFVPSARHVRPPRDTPLLTPHLPRVTLCLLVVRFLMTPMAMLLSTLT